MTQSKPHLLEQPVMVGILLTVMPPVGLTLLWATPRIPMAGKVAVSILFGMAMIALLTMRMAIA